MYLEAALLEGKMAFKILPEKQGLKLYTLATMGIYLIAFKILPEKQGLKPNIGTAEIASDAWLLRYFQKNKD